MNTARLTVSLVLGLMLLPGFAAAQTFTHVHLRVANTDEVARWYRFSVDDVAASVEKARNMGAQVSIEAREGALGYPIAMIEDPGVAGQ